LNHVSHLLALCLTATTIVFADGRLNSGAADAAPLQSELPPRAVVELFTSQGCPRSVASDGVFDQLADSSDLVVLTRPIDYWDYLGWRDTRGSAENSERQRSYARARHDRDVFTPQAIVNGVEQVVGSDVQSLQQEIARQAEEGLSPSVPVAVERSGETIGIHIGAGMRPRVPATIWIATVEPRVEVVVRAGVNAGKTRLFRNVVRRQQAIGMWRGEAVDLDLPSGPVADGDRQVVLVQMQQDGIPGPIIGATFFE